MRQRKYYIIFLLNNRVIFLHLHIVKNIIAHRKYELREKHLGKSIGIIFITASAFRKKTSKDKGSAGKVLIGAQFPRIYIKGDFNAGHRGGKMVWWTPPCMLRKILLPSEVHLLLKIIISHIAKECVPWTFLFEYIMD